MSEPTFPALPKSGSLIPGIYNYCDSWCGRCRFSSQCRVFQMRSTFERATGTDDQREAAVRKREFLELMERVNTIELTPEDEARINDIIDRQRAWVEAHPLSSFSRHYRDAALEVVDGLASMLGSRPDDVVALAFETIRHFAYLIPAKTHRALGGLADSQDDTDGGWLADEGRIYDANGSARITLIGLRQSREAWRVLLDAHIGEEIPLDMIRQLSTIDGWIAQAFPGAETFRRPGFDDERCEPSAL